MKRKIGRTACKHVSLTSLIKKTTKIGKFINIGEQNHQIREGVFIGDYVVLNDRIRFYSTKDITITIGKFCSIGDNVSFIAASSHNYSCITTYTDCFKDNILFTGKNINIGNDVRIGRNAIILKGVTIGTGAVIGAGAVVTKDIPPYAIAVGNPAKVIKYRFDDESIKKLLESKWRDRNLEKIKQNYNLDFIK